MINVCVWNETNDAIGPYESGIHNAIADFLRESGEFGEVVTATQPQEEHGLTETLLQSTDVLVYWAHDYHDFVDDTIVARVCKRVHEGMGLVMLHSGHASKVFERLMGTETGKLRWRELGELERVWNIMPQHPITKDVPEYINIPQSEMYGELFHIPTPEELIFISWQAGGEVFRSGCTWTRGAGKIFYFSPGHETFPIYYMKDIQQIIKNGIHWANATNKPHITTGHTPNPIA